LLAFYTDPFDGMVVEVYMGNFYVFRLLDIFGYHTESMILAGNFTPVFDDVFYRLVDTAVSVEHFCGPYSIRQCKQLMPQTDTEQWLFRDKNSFHGLHGIVHRRRVALAVGHEIAVCPTGFHLRKGRFCGE